MFSFDLMAVTVVAVAAALAAAVAAAVIETAAARPVAAAAAVCGGERGSTRMTDKIGIYVINFAGRSCN